jgi:hypothetical protein
MNTVFVDFQIDRSKNPAQLVRRRNAETLPDWGKALTDYTHIVPSLTDCSPVCDAVELVGGH